MGPPEISNAQGSNAQAGQSVGAMKVDMQRGASHGSPPKT